MDVRLAQIAKLNQRFNVTMSDGNNHSGCFLNHDWPFATFERDESDSTRSLDIIWLNQEHVTALYYLEELDDNRNAPTEER